MLISVQMNQIEFLLRLSENAQDAGDEIARRHQQERAAHYKELCDLHRMVELAKQNIESELTRFGLSPAPQVKQQPESGPRTPANPMPKFLKQSEAQSK